MSAPACLRIALRASALLLFCASPAAAMPTAQASPKPEGPLDGIDVTLSGETSVYADSDAVQVVTPELRASFESPTEGWSVGASYLVDVVSAASADILATASPGFQEVRHVGTVDGRYQKDDFGGIFGFYVSREPDYQSLTWAATLLLDTDEKNLSWSLTYGYGHDIAGRGTTPFSVFSRPLDRHSFNLGLVAAVNPQTQITFVLDAIVELGDPSKPYRYVPIFSSADAEKIEPGISADEVHALRLEGRPAEQLPTSKERFALTTRLAHRSGGATTRLEERVYADTWELAATTTDLRYMIDVTPWLTLWPHARFHIQKGASFWQLAYAPDASTKTGYPDLRTGDRELGPLWSLTGGGGARVSLTPDLAAQLVVDCVGTSYLEALYVRDRTAWFSALSIEALLR